MNLYSFKYTFKLLIEKINIKFYKYYDYET